MAAQNISNHLSSLLLIRAEGLQPAVEFHGPADSRLAGREVDVRDEKLVVVFDGRVHSHGEVVGGDGGDGADLLCNALPQAVDVLGRARKCAFRKAPLYFKRRRLLIYRKIRNTPTKVLNFIIA